MSLAALALGAGIPSPAEASDINGAEEIVTVADRTREGYRSMGVRVGSFIFYPELTAAVAHDDNVFAEPVGRSDTIYAIRPELLLVSDWSRHKLEFWADGEGLYYDEFTSENQENYFVGARGTLDILSDLRAHAEASHRLAHESRGSGDSFDDFDEPVEYETTKGSVSIEKEWSRFRSRWTGTVTNEDYHDVFDDGVEVDQDDRDGITYELISRSGYELSPATVVFLESTYAWRDFKDDSFDAEGRKYLAGVEFEMTRLVRGEIAGGWMDYRFDDPVREDFDTYTYRAKVYWDPTTLLSFTLLANREIGVSTEFDSSTKITSDVTVTVDYELLRNLILSGKVNWQWVDYEDTEREDDKVVTEGQLEYLVNQYVSIMAKVTHTDFESNEDDDDDEPLDYDRTIYSAGIRLTY
jgi:hypothetical protein